ncbi:MAG: hypothetical protein ORN54_11595 [Cyclobacteriaceae bacterium]|nr:hypothetical protein [Cyclobacteriaceae bacterium]
MRKIFFSPLALKQLDEWKEQNPKIASRIIILITAIAESPFQVLLNQNL